jgi:N-sulfoglucosamine sulfohydrolase
MWDAETRTYPLCLQEDGDYIGFSHKVWSPGSVRNAPYGGARNEYKKGGSNVNSFSQFVTGQIAKGDCGRRGEGSVDGADARQFPIN